MISLEKAVSLIDEHVLPLAPMSVPILDAVGCSMAEDVLSPLDIPPFDNSAMDGVALRWSDLTGDGPWQLSIQETIAAGSQPEDFLPPGAAVKIMTGAPLPSDADTVIPVEEVEFHDDKVLISKAPSRGRHVRPRGDDTRKGNCLFKKGTVLKPVDIGVLAAVGITDVKVIPRPKIAIFSTGSEIVQPGRELKYGQIYNSNDTLLKALLQRHGHPNVTIYSPSEDDPDIIGKVLVKAFDSHDVIITSGGVSMGDFDYIPSVVANLGGETIFHKVAVKPGKPVFFARFTGANSPDVALKTNDIKKDKWLIGLPGNPVSVVVGYHLYVKRIISNLMGIPYKPRRHKAKLSNDLFCKSDRMNVIGIKIEKMDGRLIAHPCMRQQSGRISSVSGIDGFMFVEPNASTISAGSEIIVEWL